MTGRFLDDDERLVLAAVGLDGAPLQSLAERAGRDPDAVAAVFHRLLRDGLVRASHDATVQLTAEGRRALLGRPTPAAEPDLASGDDITRQLEQMGTAIVGRLRERAAASRSTRRGVLASDADRDAALRLLVEAFAVGRLSPADLEQRSSQVLAARTHGELDGSLAGLGGYRSTPPSRPWRRAVFGLVAFFASPVVLLGTLLLAFGSDAGDHVGGAVVLAVMLPGILALWRWAWPKA